MKIIYILLLLSCFNGFSQRKKDDKIPHYKEKIIFFNNQKKEIIKLNEIKISKLKSNIDFYYKNINFEKSSKNKFYQNEELRLENTIHFFKLRKKNYSSQLTDSMTTKERNDKLKYIQSISNDIDSLNALHYKNKVKLDSISYYSNKFYRVEINETKKIIEKSILEKIRKISAMNNNIEIYKDSIAYAVKARKNKRF